MLHTTKLPVIRHQHHLTMSHLLIDSLPDLNELSGDLPDVETIFDCAACILVQDRGTATDADRFSQRGGCIAVNGTAPICPQVPQRARTTG